MLHVSSVSKLTIGSPPFANSILFCGRNRATTARRLSAISRRLDARYLLCCCSSCVQVSKCRVSHARLAGVECNLRHIEIRARYYNRYVDLRCLDPRYGVGQGRRQARCVNNRSNDAARHVERMTRRRPSIRQRGREGDGEDEQKIRMTGVDREINVFDLQGWVYVSLRYVSEMRLTPMTS
jgi:hypothetical protein